MFGVSWDLSEAQLSAVNFTHIVPADTFIHIEKGFE